MLAGLKVKRIWRGTDRGRLRALQRVILMISRRDVRMQQYADSKGLDGFFFADPAHPEIAAALQTISDRVDECLEMKG